MTRSDTRKSTKGEVLIVALKISATGRELLTWTLAKFTRPGDQVFALHVSSSASEADALRKTSDTANQQLDDIFEGFCNIKQIDLQVKVIHSPSLKKVLIDEAKSCNATKLILGTSSKQLATGSSSLAKYCSNRVPSTCSVLVIWCGQVVFENKGALTNPASDKSGVLNTIQQTLTSRGIKLLGQDQKGGRAIVSEKPLETRKHGIFRRRDCRDFYNNSYPCNRSLPGSVTDSPVSVLHASKHVLSQVQRAESLHGMKLPNSNLLSSPKVLGPTQSEINLERYFASHESFRDYFSRHKRGQQSALADSGFNSQESANLGEKILNEGCSPHIGPEQCPKDSKSHTETLSAALRRPWDTSDASRNPGGWPLLHRSISAMELASPRSTARRMSVVEWTLQLPDRKKKEIVEEYAELTHCRDPSYPPPLVQSGGEHNGALGKWKQSRPSEPSKEITFNECTTNHEPPFKITSMSERSAVVSHNKPCVVFQFSELQTATNNFSIGNFIGKGGCSKVYRGVLSDGQVVAVKYLNSSALGAEKDFLTEVEIISTLHHYHIVQLIGYCVYRKHYLLVYNYATEGNLEQKLYHGVKGKAVLPWDVRYKVAVGVAKALNYLHDGCARPVIHRDVKSSNILLSLDLQPQLTDFGLAQWAPTTSTHTTCSDVLGSFGYLAPEYFMYGKVNEKTDVYSFGVVLLELITGKHPVYSPKPKGQENLVLWARPLLEDESSFHLLIDSKLEESYNAWELKNMMIAAALCLRQSPHSRPRMSRILKLLLGEYEDLELFMRQDPLCREMDDGYEMPSYVDSNFRTHLTLALVDLDDDTASQASICHSGNFAYSNKFLENYLSGRYSRSSSFD